MQRTLAGWCGHRDQLLLRLRDEFCWRADCLAVANCVSDGLGFCEFRLSWVVVLWHSLTVEDRHCTCLRAS